MTVRHHSRVGPSSFDFSVKGVIVGNANTGKTCILRQFTTGEFVEMQCPTLGVEYSARIMTVGCIVSQDQATRVERRVELQLWDTAGQELYKSVTTAYYRGSSCVYVVYSVADRASFDDLGRWVNQLRQYVDIGCVFVLIGNKADLDDGDRQVQVEEGREWARVQGMLFFETSAKTGSNVAAAIGAPLLVWGERPGWGCGWMDGEKRGFEDEAPPTRGPAGGCCRE